MSRSRKTLKQAKEGKNIEQVVKTVRQLLGNILAVELRLPKSNQEQDEPITQYRAEVEQIKNFIFEQKILDLPIESALQATNVDGITFLQLLCQTAAGAIWLMRLPHVLEKIPAELLNHMIIRTFDNGQFFTSPIVALLYWESVNNGINIVSTFHSLLLPKVDPIVFTYQIPLHAERCFHSITPLQELLNLGDVGYKYIKEHPQLIDHINQQHLIQPILLAALLKHKSGIELLAIENAKLMRIFFKRYMNGALFLSDDYEVDFIGEKVSLKLPGADDYINGLVDFLSTYFERTSHNGKAVKEGNNLILTCDLLALASLMNEYPLFPSATKEIAELKLPPDLSSPKVEPEKKSNKKNKKNKKKKAKNATKATDLPVENKKGDQQKAPKPKQKCNALEWQTELEKFLFTQQINHTITTGGAKKRNNFHFIINIENVDQFQVFQHNPGVRAQISRKTYIEQLSAYLKSSNTMEVVETSEGLMITPRAESFVPFKNDRKNLIQQMITHEQGMLPQVEPVITGLKHSENVEYLFNQFQDKRGYPILVGSTLEDEIRSHYAPLDKNEEVSEQVVSEAPKESNITGEQYNERDIDMLVFTYEDDFKDCGFVKNPWMKNKDSTNETINLHKSDKILSKTLKQKVDLVLVKPNSQTLEQNIMARDFLHSTVYKDAQGNVFDLTGRAIAAIRNNELTTVDEPVRAFKRHPELLLRAIKWMLRGKNPDPQTKAAILSWSYSESKVNRILLFATLRTHLLKFDNAKYIEKLIEYNLLFKLFALKRNDPDLTLKLRRDFAGITDVKLTEKDYKDFCPLVVSSESDKPLEVVKDYYDKKLGLRFIETADHLKFPIHPVSGYPLAKNCQDEVFELKHVFVKVGTNVKQLLSAIPKLNNNDEKQKTPIEVARYQEKNGIEFILDRGGFDYPLDYFYHPIAQNFESKTLFQVKREVHRSKFYSQKYTHFFSESVPKPHAEKKERVVEGVVNNTLNATPSSNK